MNKKILALCAFMLLAVVLSAQTVQTKKQKIKVEGRANASLYLTEIYKTDNWAEYYCVYEEDKNTFDENEAEKVMYEKFLKQYKDCFVFFIAHIYKGLYSVYPKIRVNRNHISIHM